MRVLVADDEPDVRLLLRLQLERCGHDITGEAVDGVEVLSLCDADVPDAVVLDLLMPRMNGFEVIPRLKAAHPSVGIVAYTAVGGEFIRREMARLKIPLVLKNGNVAPLEAALLAAVAAHTS